MAPRTPQSLAAFCRETLPLMLKHADGSRTLKTAAAVIETDRWNSFDQFHKTTRTLVNEYRTAGAAAEVYPAQTGGRIGSGRWIIHEAADVRHATVDVVRPVRQRILDYRKNPWHVVQWSGATPQAGIRGGLVIADTPEDLARIPPGSLAGKMLLTRMIVRSCMKQIADTGAAGVITDDPVQNLPDAVPWTKFGWGGIPVEHAAVHLVGLALSENEGKKLRRLVQKRGPLTLHTRVDIRRYMGTHDVVSGLVLGQEAPDEELWVLAHSGEPGAIDNASGVALCVEIARVLEGLIAAGAIPRPRRTVRLLNAYECYGFFKYLEDVERPQQPFAGAVIDSVGARPEICDGRLEWHATIPMSAGFVDRVGAAVIRSVLRRQNPGYRLCLEPFRSTADTLIGDPGYGFPCPWITTHRKGRGFDAYHTSGDILDLLNRDGLAVCAAAASGYLYFLANAGDREASELAAAETERALGQLQALREKPAPAEITRIHEAHRETLNSLRRWIPAGDPNGVLVRLSEAERRVMDAVRDATRSATRGRRGISGSRRVPKRTVVLSPDSTNTPPDIARRIRQTELSPWALFWADGRRTLSDIAGALTCEYGREVRVEQVIAFFNAHADLGYVAFD